MTVTTQSNDDTRMDEVEDLKRELERKKKHLREEKPELYTEITKWCDQARTQNVEGIRVLIRQTLSRLQRDHKMRNHRGVDDPSEAFPEECEGCEHYEVACPFAKNFLVICELEQILEEEDDEVRIREEMYELASRHGCHVIQQKIENWEERWAGFVKRGYRLRNALDAHVFDLDEEELPMPREGEGGTVDVRRGDEHSPPSEVQDRVEEVVSGATQQMKTDGGDN